MILFISEGRLGNQLFQYAFLRTIAKEKEKILATNMDEFLSVFDIHNNNFIHVKLGKFSKYFARKIFKPLLRRIANLKLIGYIQQDRNEVSALPSYRESFGLFPIRFVEGYFQSETFFDKSKIDFTIKESYLKKAEEFLSKLPKNATKVFIHVRRGDYINESYLGIKGIDLPENYFRRAIKEITKEVENPFFIFLSDDPSYVKCCFKDINNKIISENDMGTDLAIMSLCEYGVVSNSSFSWWGAFLMKNRKKVIFPKYWYGWKVKIESHIGIQPEWAVVIDFEQI